MSFLVLGIDAGSTTTHRQKKGVITTVANQSGYCVLDMTREPAIWHEGALVRNDDAQSFLERWRGFVDLVVVETPVAMHNPLANRFVMQTAGFAGEWKAYARVLGFPLESISPQQWRASLIGHARKGQADRMVKATLERMVEGMPRCPVHCRDAAGAALIGASIFRRRVA